MMIILQQMFVKVIYIRIWFIYHQYGIESALINVAFKHISLNQKICANCS